MGIRADQLPGRIWSSCPRTLLTARIRALEIPLDLGEDSPRISAALELPLGATRDLGLPVRSRAAARYAGSCCGPWGPERA